MDVLFISVVLIALMNWDNMEIKEAIPWKW